jgi:deoxyribonuclease-4
MKRSLPPSRRARTVNDELGAHVSTAGGLELAPARAALLGSRVLQLFTKQPSRWAERILDDRTVSAFRAARRRHRIRVVSSHDSYLINLATADRVLFARSFDAFRAEFDRCAALGIEFLVTHPGNATDGDVHSALARNAAAVERALHEHDASISVLFETTAGAGSALGATFEQLALLIERIGPPANARVGVCMDTCHVWAAGYDLRRAYDAVMQRFADTVGLHRLRLFHLNDSVAPLGSRRDRHAHIGRGALGAAPFRRLLDDARFRRIPKLLETPKDDDPVAADLRNLRRLRRYRTPPGGRMARRGIEKK